MWHRLKYVGRNAGKGLDYYEDLWKRGEVIASRAKQPMGMRSIVPWPNSIAMDNESKSSFRADVCVEVEYRKFSEHGLEHEVQNSAGTL